MSMIRQVKMIVLPHYPGKVVSYIDSIAGAIGTVVWAGMTTHDEIQATISLPEPVSIVGYNVDSLVGFYHSIDTRPFLIPLDIYEGTYDDLVYLAELFAKKPWLYWQKGSMKGKAKCFTPYSWEEVCEMLKETENA